MLDTDIFIIFLYFSLQMNEEDIVSSLFQARNSSTVIKS